MSMELLQHARAKCSRAVLAVSACAVGLAALCPPALADETTGQGEFTFGDVVARAEALAGEPFEEQPQKVPQFLLVEGSSDSEAYDLYRDIRFRKERALWRGADLPFQVEMFHPGLFFERAVEINVVDDGKVEPLRFSKGMFDYGDNDFSDRLPEDLGFAGLRLHAPYRKPGYYDEVAVFLGASYFRAVGATQNFGLSARGLAIDTAAPKGEEFPFFKAFWLHKPAPDDDTLTVYALLDSPSVAGAYEFVVRPGELTIMDIRATLFPRRAIDKLGIAPLTSMFFFGENTTERPVDYRPEVHDSDSLLIITDTGEWLRRPLRNPEELSISSFALENPGGFGLVQRDRDFDHYQDLEARYDTRPSAWVTPRGDWGKGRIELIQIPINEEFHDNIVAFWVPDRAPSEGGMTFAYRLAWYLQEYGKPPGGQVASTRVVPGEGQGVTKFLLSFEGDALAQLPADTPTEAVINVGDNGELLEHQIEKNPVTQGWRLVFKVRAEGEEPLELRAFLKHNNDFLTETWSYVIER